MLLHGVRRPGIIICVVLYCLVFVITHHGVTIQNDDRPLDQPGLLLFMVPGMIIALANREAPLSVALLGALMATPLCLVSLHTHFSADMEIWQELAWLTSAIFWCGSGALFVMFGRKMFRSNPW